MSCFSIPFFVPQNKMWISSKKCHPKNIIPLLWALFHQYSINSPCNCTSTNTVALPAPQTTKPGKIEVIAESTILVYIKGRKTIENLLKNSLYTTRTLRFSLISFQSSNFIIISRDWYVQFGEEIDKDHKIAITDSIFRNTAPRLCVDQSVRNELNE